MVVTVILKCIGDYSDIVEIHESYNKALDRSKELELDTHSRGYTDFKYKIAQFDLLPKD